MKNEHKTIVERLNGIEKEVKEFKDDLKKLPQLLASQLQATPTSNQPATPQDAQQIQQAVINALQAPPVQQAIEQAIQRTLLQPNFQQMVQQAVNQTTKISQAPQEPPRQQLPSKTINVYIYRDESAKTCCLMFHHQLQGYLNEIIGAETQRTGFMSWFGKAERLSVVVQEVNGIDAIDKEGIVLICGYTAAARLDASSMVYLRELLLRKSNLLRVEFVVFRFGESAVPAKVFDERAGERDKVVPSHPIFFTSEGLVLNALTVESIKRIVVPTQ